MEGVLAGRYSQKIMRRSKRLLRMSVDALAWICAGWLATMLRYDGQIPSSALNHVLKFGVLSVAVALLINSCFSLYIGRYRNASLEEFLALTLANSFSVVVIFSIRIWTGEPQVPRSVPIITGFLALNFILVSRVLATPRAFPMLSRKNKGKRTLIYGAGIAGRQLAEQMIFLNNDYDPIGFLDDDATKSKLKILGRPVFGAISELERVIKLESPKILIIAISQIDSSALLAIERTCRLNGIVVRIIPTPYEILSGAVQLADIEDISEEDLLGRRPITDNDLDISNFIQGKRILITGAGGSIGSEIARQIHHYSPLSLTLIDRDETALLKLQLSLDGTGSLTNGGLVLGDIRDLNRMIQIFNEVKPEIVFHAAALKHLTTLQRFPEEATKTNVVGTQNVLKAAQMSNVATFVNISTDKAADPSSALGISKLVTERMTAGIEGDEKKYISVRFGNVIGSNGSFLHTFRHQIRHGGPVTVTHPDVTRFFMTVSEAVHLVLQSAIIGRHGETLILDMGEPISINQIAHMMIEKSGRQIQIIYTGLREGEKLHEVLVSPEETLEVRENPLIMHTKVSPLFFDKDDLETPRI